MRRYGLRLRLDAGMLAAWFAMSMIGSVRAAEHPLWELGMGVGAVAFNDYRGADTTHAYPVPVPYFIYRGSILRSDRDGVHGLLFDQRYLKFDISVNATAPVFSRNSAPRRGMPNLDSTVEIGPALQAHVWQSDDQRLRLNLTAPVRSAITVASAPRAIGWVFAPNLSLDVRGAGRESGWNLGVLGGPLFAQRQYHQYFYGVAPQYATSERPAYQAPGGYAGSQLLLSLSRQFENYWVGAYLRHDWLQGAVFDPSPLVQQRSYWSGGLGIVWIIKTSSRMVDRDE